MRIHYDDGAPRSGDREMDSRDPIKDFFSFLLGAVLLSMGAFLFFNAVGNFKENE